MADVYTRIGYIKGATGATGAQGVKGDTGDAATIAVGTVTTVPYGQTANVVNSGTSGAAVFDFTIPQGKPGEQTTDMQNLTLGSITTSSASFPVPAVGETGKVLWGKVVKWFSDMAALVATKLNIDHVVNNLTTTTAGYALDARQGKALNDKVSKIGDIESIYDGTVATATFTAVNNGTYLCVIADGGSSAMWICSKKSTGTPGLAQIFNNATSRFSASVNENDITITSAQYGALITVTRLG